MIRPSRQCSNASPSTTPPPERHTVARPPQRHGSSRRLSPPSHPAVSAHRLSDQTHPAAHAALERKHTMAERTVTIASKTGLHARPAGIFAKAAEQQPATVTIEKPGGNAVQASSMLMLMTLGAAQ